MTIFAVILGVLIVVALFLTASAVLEGRKARAVTKASYDCVVALSDVAEAAHELSQVDLRTAVSMDPGAFQNGKNPRAAAAKMRGYEVWRNERLTPEIRRLRAAYARYETSAALLVRLIKLSPLAVGFQDFETWRKNHNTPPTEETGIIPMKESLR